MHWNWQQKTWPHFSYSQEQLALLEAKFIHSSGVFLGAYTHVLEQDKKVITVNLISNEALKTSEIEGEYLDRDSVQASVAYHFGLTKKNHHSKPSEQGIAEMMVHLYETFAEPLSEHMLGHWHSLLMNGRRDLQNIGEYRIFKEAMQIISGPIGHTTVHFEAPPSEQIPKEMSAFIQWFNDTAPNGSAPLPTLTRAGIAHFYFESIHPFEDGNGRIGRAIAEKSLAQSLGYPTLIALSQTLQKHRKKYYEMLGVSNASMDISIWLNYFANTVLEAQQYTQSMIEFLINKTKWYDRLRGQLNARQEKAIARVFREGVEGFKGGLSAENYISITQTSRATATRDLQDLVEKSGLFQIGARKSTRYFLKFEA